MSQTPDSSAFDFSAQVDFDDPKQSWRVTAARLDVFAIPTDATGEQVETGRYLFTLTTGQVGFCVAPCSLPGGQWLAIRAKGTSETKVSSLSANALSPEQPDAAAVNLWLLKLAGSLRDGRATDTITILDQERRRAVTIAEAGTNSPLFQHVFELANAHLLSLLTEDLSADRAREAARIQSRLRQSAFAFAEGLRSASAVLRQSPPPGDVIRADDPLFSAASLVAASQKITLKRVRSHAVTSHREALDLICRASRMQLRKVNLEGDWYRRESGPILGFVGEAEETSRPVALLPVARSAYELVDPELGVRSRIGPREARSLLPTAFIFYRAFETSPVTAKDLIRFSLTGMSRDLTRALEMGLLGGLLGLALPLLSDPLFNDVLPRADGNTLATVVLALAMGALGSSAFQVVRDFSLLRVEGRMEGSVQSALWDRLLNLAPGFFRDYATGDLAARVLNVTTIRSVLTLAISGSVFDALFSILSFAVMFWYSWRLSLVAVALAAAAVALTLGLLALQLPQQREAMQKMGELDGLTYQMLTAVGKLRTAGAEARTFGRWTGILAQGKSHAYRARRIAAAQATLTQTFPPLTSLALYLAVIRLGEPILGSEGHVPLLTLGGFLAFTTAFSQFVSALMSMVTGLSSVVSIVPLFERLRPILSTVPESAGDTHAPGLLTGRLEFRALTFRYQADMPPALSDVSFKVGPCDYVALVGPSGSGKSTILRLALGFETAQSGGVFYDGRDVATLDLGELRQQIGVVLQNAGLLTGSLYENIAGSQQISMQEVWEAARLAGLEADIKAMPMGMHTLLSDSAPTLSGGQRQRVIIARALVRKPRILIFDEATSALDNHTQAIVNETLAGLTATRIIIAHRLSTVRNVDRILVFNGGRIVESGSYDDLLAQGGTFSDLVRQQLP